MGEVYETLWVLGVLMSIFGGGISLVVGLAFLTEKVGSRMRNVTITLVGSVIFIIGCGLLAGGFPIPSPGIYSEVGRFDGKILLIDDKYEEEAIVPEKKIEIGFTTDKDKIGKFVYDFKWVKYRPATEDIKKVVAVRDGVVYYISKSDGKIKKMAQDFYKRYKE